MTYFIDRVRLLIEQNEVHQATDKLLTVLRNGSKEILDRATLMTLPRGKEPQDKQRKIPKITTPKLPSSLTHFLVQLEEDEPLLVKFLSHIELAEQSNSKGDWSDTKQHLESALAVHDDSFSLSKAEIIHQIQLCDNALIFNDLIASANQEFLQQNWQAALITYGEALEALDRDFDTTKINKQISICERGIRFEQYLNLAELAKSKQEWAQACTYFKEALNLNVTDYYPEALGLNIQDDLRNCSKKIQRQGSGFTFIMKKTGTTPLLLIGILAFLALYLYYPQLTGLIEQKFAKESPFAEDNQNILMDSLEDHLVVEKAAAISPDTLSIDSAITDLSEVTSAVQIEEEPQEKEAFTFKEEPQIVLAPEINVAPTPNQIQQLLKPKSLPKKKQSEIEAEEPEEEEVSFEMGRVAIIPFCHEQKDKNLAKRVYMDASFAVRTAGKSNQSAVSRSLVQGVIRKLDLSKNNFCSETGAKKIARSLRAESVLIGTISHLPDKKIRINCEVLHIPSLRYSGEIVLTDRNVSRLRNKLKQEIQQVFN